MSISWLSDQVSIYNYDESVVKDWYDGMQLKQSNVEKLMPVVKVHPKKGKAFKAIATIAEKDKMSIFVFFGFLPQFLPAYTKLP